MKHHPIIGALVVGAVVGMSYGVLQVFVLKKPLPTSMVRYAPWLAGAVAGYFIFK